MKKRFNYSDSEDSIEYSDQEKTSSNSIYSKYDTYSKKLSGTYCHTSNACEPQLCGPPGPCGPPGSRGPQGPIGPPGVQGCKGDKGDPGRKGDIGLMGPIGRQGNEGRRGPQGIQGEIGKRGPTGPLGGLGSTGTRGPTGAGGGTNLRCINIRYSGWAGITVPRAPPIGDNGVIVLDLKFLDCRADLWYATGNPINQSSWAQVFDPPTTPYWYYQFGGTNNLVCPGNAGLTGITGGTGLTGCTGTAFRNQLWYVIPTEDATSDNPGVIIPIENIYPDLKEGDKIFDSCSSRLYSLNNCSWECCGNFRGDNISCINLRYQGFGGISLPRVNPDESAPLNLYFLDYGGPDADLWVTTGEVYPNDWRQVVLPGTVQNPEPYFYFEILNEPDPTASQGSITATTDTTSTLTLAGTITGTFTVGQIVRRDSNSSVLGVITALGTGTGQAGTYILDRPNALEGPIVVYGGGIPPYFTSQNTGRIWYVEPVPGATSTQNGRATQYCQLCNMQAGDKVIDSSTGNFYTMLSGGNGTCYWTCSPILPCPPGGNCTQECGIRSALDIGGAVPCCNIRGPTGPAGPPLRSGCIAYTGRCGPLLPYVPPPGYLPGDYFLDAGGDWALFQVLADGVSWSNPIPVGAPYLYFCVTNLTDNVGTIYNVVPHPEPHSPENGCGFNLGTDFGLVRGTKFIDCCSGRIFTLETTNAGNVWTCAGDFPVGFFAGDLGQTGCTGFFVGPTGTCCTLGGATGSGDTLDCINILFSGRCSVNLNNCPGATGQFMLTLNDGGLFQWNGTSWALPIQPLNYYYLCNEFVGPTGCTGATGATGFGIYFVTGVISNVTAPVPVATQLGLSDGAKILDCATSNLYELRGNSWFLCCAIGRGVTGPTGAAPSSGSKGVYNFLYNGGCTGATGCITGAGSCDTTIIFTNLCSVSGLIRGSVQQFGTHSQGLATISFSNLRGVTGATGASITIRDPFLLSTGTSYPVNTTSTALGVMTLASNGNNTAIAADVNATSATDVTFTFLLNGNTQSYNGQFTLLV